MKQKKDEKLVLTTFSSAWLYEGKQDLDAKSRSCNDNRSVRLRVDKKMMTDDSTGLDGASRKRLHEVVKRPLLLPVRHQRRHHLVLVGRWRARASPRCKFPSLIYRMCAQRLVHRTDQLQRDTSITYLSERGILLQNRRPYLLHGDVLVVSHRPFRVDVAGTAWAGGVRQLLDELAVRTDNLQLIRITGGTLHRTHYKCIHRLAMAVLAVRRVQMPSSSLSVTLDL